MKNNGLGKYMKDKWEVYALLLPFTILFLIFTVLPVLSAIVLSFTNFNMLEFPQWVGLVNYKRMLLEDDLFVIALKNTVIFAFITGPLSYFIALFAAWLINQFPKNARVVFTVIFYAPSVAGNVYFIWQYLFSGDSYGFVNSFLLRMGIVNSPILWFSDPKYNLYIIMIVQLWLSLGTGFLAFIAGLQSIDKSQYEAAAVDGVTNRFQEFIYVTIPNMKHMLLFGAVMQIAGAFSVGAITAALAGGAASTDYSAYTIINMISDYGQTRYEMGYASAVAVVLFAAMVGTKRLIFKLLGR